MNSSVRSRGNAVGRLRSEARGTMGVRFDPVGVVPKREKGERGGERPG